MATYRVATLEKLSAKCVIGGAAFHCMAIKLDTVFSGTNHYGPSETYSSISGSLPLGAVEGEASGFVPVGGDKQFDTTNKFWLQRRYQMGLDWGYRDGSTDRYGGGSNTSGNYTVIFYPYIYLDRDNKIIFNLELKSWSENEVAPVVISLPGTGRFGNYIYDINSTLPTGTYDYRASNNISSVFSFSEWTNDPYAQEGGEGDISGGASGGASGGVHIPGFPGLTATDTGIIGLFAPSTSQMRQLADYMWTDFGGTGTEVVDVLKEIVDAIKRSISNPLDYVMGLNIIPSQGLSVGASSEIKFGFTNSGVSMPRLSNQYFTVNCGSISFSPVCGDTFLDYAPYSKFSIYLPYIGVKELDPNDCVGHTIGVTYHGDVVTGGLTAYITKDGAVIYQFSGCCALSIPLSSDGWGSTIAGTIQIATQLISSASGGAAGVVAEAAKDAASVAANPSLLSPQVAHSGAISGGAGAMGIQTPFIIREAVRFHSTVNFNTVTGYPSHYYKKIGDLTGYTIMYDVHLHDIPATKAEISEIEALLKSGVIL